MDDFLIIGGGIAGVSAGGELASLGRVTLLEAEDALGYHASGRSAALFEEHYGLPATVALNRASRAAHRDVFGVLSPRGLMLVGLAGEEAQFDRDLSAMPMERIDVPTAAAMIPILNTESVTRVAHDPEAWDIDTDRLIQLYARALRINGQIVTRAPVEAITRTRRGWRVSAGSRDYEACTLVNAAGAWADRIAAMAGIARIGLSPRRRSIARIPPPGGHEVKGWPMMLGAGESWYAKPDAGKLIVSPAEEDPAEPHDAWADDMVLAEGIVRYEAAVTEPVTRVETTWAGLRTFASDRHLVLGRDPGDPDFVWCAGQGGYGFQTAPAASRLIAALLGGTPPELDADIVAALDPRRFARVPT